MKRTPIVIFIFTLLGSSYAQLESSCITPDKHNGTCRLITDCELLRSCISKPLLTSEKIKFLRQSLCEFDGNRRVIVCCDPAYRPSTTNTTANPCYPEVLPSLSDELPGDCGESVTQRIYGGTHSHPTEFPWAALLEYDTPLGVKTLCSGTLISNNYVLTAAHCIGSTKLPELWNLTRVRFGEYNTATNPDCFKDSETSEMCLFPVTSIPIEEIILHENYSNILRNQWNDIALIKLSSPVEFTDVIKPICLPGTSDEPRNFVSVGWGQTENSRSSDVKLKVHLPHSSKADCQKAYPFIRLPREQICAGGERGIDSCGGDSGGPLMAPATDLNGRQRWTIFGITSYGTGKCGSVNKPGIYTKVSAYINWIMEKMT